LLNASLENRPETLSINFVVQPGLG
jgi:hypothetical protein